jgi:Spy/CpxP family protein refolding chaperone
MPFQSKIALALLSLLMALPAARAQAQDQNGSAGPGPGMGQQRPPRGHDDAGKWHARSDDWRGGPERGGWRDGRGMGMRSHGRRRGEFVLARIVNDPGLRERLGITPDQAAKIRQQTADFRKSQIRNRADLEVKRLELRELVQADNPDRNAIDRKLQEISAAQLTQSKSAIDFRLDMRSALTPEQRQKLQQMREERGRGFGGQHGGPRGTSPRRPPQSGPPSPAPNQPGEGD